MKEKFDRVALLIWEAITLLKEVQPHLTRQDDKSAIKSILTDLTWANENCSVMGRHQMGEALDDTMGY